MKKGSIVKWKSQSHGRFKTKVAKIIAIVPKRVFPWVYVPIGMYLEKGDAKRPHESYLVKIKGSNRLYHPRVSHLKLCKVRTWLSRYLWPSLGLLILMVLFGIVGRMELNDTINHGINGELFSPYPGPVLKSYPSQSYTPPIWIRNYIREEQRRPVVRIEGGQVYDRRWKQIGYVKDGQVYNLKGERKGVAP